MKEDADRAALIHGHLGGAFWQVSVADLCTTHHTSIDSAFNYTLDMGRMKMSYSSRRLNVSYKYAGG